MTIFLRSACALLHSLSSLAAAAHFDLRQVPVGLKRRAGIGAEDPCEQLRQHLWPSDTFVDFNHSLNSALMKLREALDDSADKPLYIEIDDVGTALMLVEGFR